jgi:hypothetical protein
MASLHGGSGAGKSDLCCGHSLDAEGRPGLHQSGLMSFCFAGCFSPGPRKNDLTIYWALGPFVRSFTLLVDPGDIYPPQLPSSDIASPSGLALHSGNMPCFRPELGLLDCSVELRGQEDEVPANSAFGTSLLLTDCSGDSDTGAEDIAFGIASAEVDAGSA